MIRKLKLMCLKHPNVTEMEDTGNTREGEFTSNRQAIRRVLEKRTALADGRKIHTFVLAEEPKHIFDDEDTFDLNVLKDSNGRWRLPTPEWLKEQEAFCAEEKRRAEEAANRANDILRRDVADGLTELLSQTRAISGGGRGKAKKGAEE